VPLVVIRAEDLDHARAAIEAAGGTVRHDHRNREKTCISARNTPVAAITTDNDGIAPPFRDPGSCLRLSTSVVRGWARRMVAEPSA
jgi:hypothetical protein